MEQKSSHSTSRKRWCTDSDSFSRGSPSKSQKRDSSPGDDELHTLTKPLQDSPPSKPYNTFVSLAPNPETRLKQLNHLIVFGDSFSDNAYGTWGNPFAESFTVPPEVLNYATGGHTVEDDLEEQIEGFLSEHSKDDPLTLLDDPTTAYATWIGINDCAEIDEEDIPARIEKIMDGLHDLYIKAKARKFIIIDLPPQSRAPGAENRRDLSSTLEVWNKELISQVETFTDSTKNASVLLVSAHHIISSILDDPSTHRFTQEGAIVEIGKGMWSDQIHLTSQVHDIIAVRMREAFKALGQLEVPASKQDEREPA